MIWFKLFCDIGQRAKYVNVRAFQSLCFFLIINFQVNKRTGVEWYFSDAGSFSYNGQMNS